jgi:hypothetical protein
MGVPVSTAGGALRSGKPVKLFRIWDSGQPWDPHPDGKRFLMGEREEAAEAKPASIHIIENWPALLRR